MIFICVVAVFICVIAINKRKKSTQTKKEIDEFEEILIAEELLEDDDID